LVEGKVGVMITLEKSLAASNFVLAMVALIVSFRVIAGQDIDRRGVLALAFASGLVFAVRVSMLLPGNDFDIYWRSGRYVLEGVNPYTVKLPPGAMRTLYPPNALSLFVPFGLFSERAAWAIFRTINMVLAIAAVPLSWAALTAQEGRRSPGLSWPVVVVLSNAFALSSAVYFGIGVGTFSMVTTVLGLAALYAQGRGTPILAGILLALASVKIHTLVPTLLLFHRRSDWPTWVSLGVLVGALCILATPPGKLSLRLRDNLANIEADSQPGAMNDYSFRGPLNSSIVGFEHLFYRLGLRDRTAIHWLQYAAVALLGVGIIQLLARVKISRGGACSLVLLYATIFLYHRLYDTVILALPMLHASGRARSERGRTRWCFAGCAISILLTLAIFGRPLDALGRASLAWPPAAKILTQAIVLPCATWLILAAMGLLVLGEMAADTQNRLARTGRGREYGSVGP
jgi:Glycosyltransferase family 87